MYLFSFQNLVGSLRRQIFKALAGFRHEGCSRNVSKLILLGLKIPIAIFYSILKNMDTTLLKKTVYAC